MNARSWSDVRMSPTKLGALSNPECCERCYWTLLRMKFNKPFNFPMPNILNSLDRQEKQLAKVFLDRHGVFPEYFGAFRDAVEILPVESVSGFHEETGIELYGKPDLVTKDADGELSVIDNKTAQVKPPEHALSEMYKTQINFYGYVLEKSNTPAVVSRIGLLYYSISPLSDDEILANAGSDNMWALFRPSMLEIEYDPENIVVPLLRRVRALIDSTEAPKGIDGCKDCELLKAFQNCLSVTDSGPVRLMDQRERQRHYYRERQRELSGVDDIHQYQLDSLPAIAGLERPLGALAQWI
jgi:hypothetical protein